MAPLPPMRSRHTPRLAGYDYRQPGTYFVTIVTSKRACVFGDINDEKMHRNANGDIVAEDWLVLPSHFPSAFVADFVVMPNHFHGIITLENDPAVTVSLSVVIGAFKSGVTRRVNLLQETPGAILWQRSYHDRRIRGEAELIRIQEYIGTNPLKWAVDKENPGEDK